ncbi:hypothetical protein [Faecalibacillus faecis]|uniref:HNH endonuclease n=1 Tax=Faecalibacillus faecis TaxID=1982628 RepID=UPI003866B083
MKKSYYLEEGLYFDTTTQTIYEPKHYCEICGRRNMLTVHHKLVQHKCLKDLATKKTITPSTWTQEFINKNQKLFTVCLQCHSDIHNYNNEVFFDKYKRNRSEFIYK